MTSIQLANMFLNGRESAHLSIKQTSWLVDVLKKERKITTHLRTWFLNTDQINDNPNGYVLNLLPNGCSLLKPVAVVGGHRPSYPRL